MAAQDDTLAADDAAIRAQAARHLAEAAAALNGAEASFRRRHLPLPTREAPLPDPARMAELRSLKAVQALLAEAQTRLGGAAAIDAKALAKSPRAADVSTGIARCDVAVAGAARSAREAASLTAGAVADAADLMGPPLTELRAALETRASLLHEAQR